VLAYVDRPTDRPPDGTKFHNVVMTRQAAESALGTLIGMGIGYSTDFTGHDPSRKAGIITDAQIVADRIEVQGYVFAHDFPALAREYYKRPNEWGMSYEVSDAHILDMRASIWEITKVTFTGAAILLRYKGAFRDTKFELVQEEQCICG
jgi:hypothetical protein